MGGVAENAEFIRIVGGRVLSNTVVSTPVIRIESFRRDVSKRVQWHFKQPELALFFYRRGARKLRGKMDGRSFDQQLAGNLAVYPAGLEIDGEFTVTSARSEYTVVFFDQAFISDRLPCFSAAPRLGFDNPAITFGLEELCGEPHHDDVYAMMAEGWATQTLACLQRMSGTKAALANRGGLTQCSLKRISEFVEENLGRSIGLTEMASLVGLSTRHFIRAFSESTGDTPHQYVIGRRIERAKCLLVSKTYSLTEIGLAVGFSHSQHFTTKFKKHTGVSPSHFRAATRG